MKKIYINPKNRVIQIDMTFGLLEGSYLEKREVESPDQWSRKERFFDGEEVASPSRKSLWD